MKLIHAGLASLLIIGTAGSAFAQSSVYTDPKQCTTEVGGLDVNADGYVDAAEMKGRGEINTNVDVNGDGRISRDEMTVACDSKTMEALTPKG